MPHQTLIDRVDALLASAMAGEAWLDAAVTAAVLDEVRLALTAADDVCRRYWSDDSPREYEFVALRESLDWWEDAAATQPAAEAGVTTE